MDKDISKKSASDKGSERAKGRSAGVDYQPIPFGAETEMLALHSAIGNQGVGRLLQPDGGKPGMIQAKLTVSQPGDKYELEADRVADMVMRMPELYLQRQVEPKEEVVQTNPLASQITPLIRRQVESEEKDNEVEIQMKPLSSVGAVQDQPIEEEKEEKLQAKELPGRTPVVAPQIQGRINALRGSGQPLPESLRAFYEPRFGMNLSRTRIHTGRVAAEITNSLNARAFTLGWDIMFASGQYSPESFDGRKLLAHELTHTFQQNLSQQKSGAVADVVQRLENEPAFGYLGGSPEARAFLEELIILTLPEMLERVQEIDDSVFLHQVDLAYRNRKWDPSEVERAWDIGRAIRAQGRRIQRGEVTAEERQRRKDREKKRRRDQQIKDFEAGRTATPGTEEFERLLYPSYQPKKKRVPTFDVGPNEVKRIHDPERGDQIIWSKGGQIVVYREPPANLRKQIIERTGSEHQANIIEPSARVFYQHLFQMIQDDEGNPTLDPRIAHGRLVKENEKLLTMAILGSLANLLPTPGPKQPLPRARAPKAPTYQAPGLATEVLTLEGRAKALWERLKLLVDDATDELAPAPVTTSGVRVRPPKKERNLTFNETKGAPKSGSADKNVEKPGKTVEEGSKDAGVAQAAKKAIEPFAGDPEFQKGLLTIMTEEERRGIGGKRAAVLEDPKARAQIKKKPSPGRQPPQFVGGNFVHRFAEYILGRKRLPRPNEAEVVVPFRDGTGKIIRVDRIIRTPNEGVLYEIKPAGKSAEIGRAELPGRLEALQKEFPKKNGWSGQVVEYTRDDVKAWLLAEGVPKRNIPNIMKELGF
jgi:Domain of unknown function (DUF4157)